MKRKTVKCIRRWCRKPITTADVRKHGEDSYTCSKCIKSTKLDFQSIFGVHSKQKYVRLSNREMKRNRNKCETCQSGRPLTDDSECALGSNPAWCMEDDNWRRCLHEKKCS